MMAVIQKTAKSIAAPLKTARNFAAGSGGLWFARSSAAEKVFSLLCRRGADAPLALRLKTSLGLTLFSARPGGLGAPFAGAFLAPWPQKPSRPASPKALRALES